MSEETLNQPRKKDDQFLEDEFVEESIDDENLDDLDDIYNKLAETPLDDNLEELDEIPYDEELDNTGYDASAYDSEYPQQAVEAREQEDNLESEALLDDDLLSEDDEEITQTDEEDDSEVSELTDDELADFDTEDEATESEAEEIYDDLPEESFEPSDELSDDELLSEDDELPEESFEASDELTDDELLSEGEDQELSEELLDDELLNEDESDELMLEDSEDLLSEDSMEDNAEYTDEDGVSDEPIDEDQDHTQVHQAVVDPEPEEVIEEAKFVIEDVKAEIHVPVPFENTAKYLLSLPILGDIVKEKFISDIKKETDDVKLRRIRVATQKEIIAELKEQKQPYIITHFTNQENLCNVDKNCEHKLFYSVYYEVSNPVTNKNVMITAQMFHNMTRHHMVYFNEPLLNLGNSPQGFFDAYLPCGDLITALTNSNAPSSVMDELNAVKEKIEYLEYERFAAVRANIQFDMSVFEQTEYEKEHNIVPFYALLRTMVNWGAEDIHIKAGFRPMGVLGGNVVPCPSFPEFLTPERTKYYSSYLLTEPQIQQFEETLEMDNSFYVPNVARFRCNMYHSQGSVGLVFRVIPTKIRPVEVLGVPMILKKLVFERLGLVLVTGQTGSGKTTTLAAIVEFCNVNRAIHILTLENPVEYVYESKSSIFTQRAIEIDSLSFPMAMRGALRQKPDIILIGEMRDPDTIMAGLKAAETGHLVMSTLHTNDAVQTINRIVNTFPPHEQETIRVQVGSTIKACVAQRLIPRFDKPGRVCSIEVLLVTPNARGQNTRGYIIRNEVPELYKVVATSGYDGMQSMNMALFEHYRNGVITPDDALSYSDNPDEITRWMREDMGLGVANM